MFRVREHRNTRGICGNW